MRVLFFNGDFIKSLLCTGDSDVDEVLFLIFHPGLGSVLRWHPSIAAEEINRGPFEPFGLMNRGEG